MPQDTVRIKGTRNGLVIVLDPSCDFEVIKESLLQKMETAKGFFKGAKFSLAQSHKDIPTNQKNELENICRKFGLVPNTEEYTGTKSDFSPVKVEPSFVNDSPGEAALLVRRSIRSGQKISSPAHVIILGNVHPGAEIVAGGNVLVVGYCRGVIRAGAEGNRKAKVIAHPLNPTIISIADRKYTPNHNEKFPFECQLAMLKGEEIIFKPYLKMEDLSLVKLN